MTVKIDGTNTETNPAFTGADTDTGLQCGTDELKLVTGGTARATVDSSGSCGIGTTSPGNRLHVASGSSTQVRYQATNSASVYTRFQNTDNARGYVGYEAKRLVFYADNGSDTADKKVAVMDADGLKFGSDTAAANALDDYEEGTFTPRLVIENSGDVTIYTNKKGSYVKVGSTVTVWFNMTVNGTPSGRSTSNAIEFHDLPFTSTDDDNDGAQYYIGSVRINDVDTSHTYGDFSEAAIRLFNNNTMGRIECRVASTSALANSSLWLKDNTTIHATITYRTDS